MCFLCVVYSSRASCPFAREIRAHCRSNTHGHTTPHPPNVPCATVLERQAFAGTGRLDHEHQLPVMPPFPPPSFIHHASCLPVPYLPYLPYLPVCVPIYPPDLPSTHLPSFATLPGTQAPSEISSEGGRGTPRIMWVSRQMSLNSILALRTTRHTVRNIYSSTDCHFNRDRKQVHFARNRSQMDIQHMTKRNQSVLTKLSITGHR